MTNHPNRNKRLLALQASHAELMGAAANCIVPLEWARDHIDQIFATKVQANIDAIRNALTNAKSITTNQ